jgi:hypothetical protein
MGFADNFTRPPSLSPVKRSQLSLLSPTAAVTAKRNCANLIGWDSKALELTATLGESPTRQPRLARHHSDREFFPTGKSHLADRSGTNELACSMERQFGRSISAVNENRARASATSTVPTATTPLVDPSDYVYESPMREVARNISWGNMEDFFNNLSVQVDDSPPKKKPLRTPQPTREIVVSRPQSHTATKERVDDDAVSPQRREQFKSPLRSMAKKLSLRSMCASRAEDDADCNETDESKQKRRELMRKGLSIDDTSSSLLLTQNARRGKKCSGDKSFRTPRHLSLQKSISMQGFRPRIKRDDDSTSGSTTMDRSTHSTKSYRRTYARPRFKNATNSTVPRQERRQEFHLTS